MGREKESLFSKRIDDLLPGDAKRISAPTPSDEFRPTLGWWQNALLYGIVFVLITGFRFGIRVLTGAIEIVDGSETALVMLGAFGVGCVFGIAIWGFQWLRWNLSQTKE